MTEADIYDKLKTIKDFYWLRIESMTESGIPDLNGIHNGQEFWVELKIGAPRLKPSQVAWHTRAHAQGRRVFILTYERHAYRLIRGTKFTRIDFKHFTPEDKPLIISPEIEDITPCLTSSYK